MTPLLKKRLGIASHAAVNQYLAQARDEGLDIAAILQQMRLNSARLSSSDGYITGVQFQQLITLLLQYSDNPLFGLESARFVREDSYSVLGYIVMHCATFGEAVAKVQPFEALVGDMGVTRVEHGEATCKIRWICQYTEPAVIQQMVDNCLASWLGFTRGILGPEHSPVQVLLRRPAPSLAEQQRYSQVFNCPVHFNQEMDALEIDNKLLALSPASADPAQKSKLENQAQARLAELNQALKVAEQVEMLVLPQLPMGLPKIDTIASQMGLHGKTLQRRLRRENTSFARVLDRVRLKQSSRLLNMADLSLLEVSQLLGFTEPRSFYRWFKQQTGKTPRQS